MKKICSFFTINKISPIEEKEKVRTPRPPITPRPSTPRPYHFKSQRPTDIITVFSVEDDILIRRAPAQKISKFFPEVRFDPNVRYDNDFIL